MQNISQKTGQEGEALAKAYLEEKGYQILESNWRFKKLEVDLIALRQQTIVFVEVKTRKNGTFGEPEIFVSKKKQKFLVTAAHQYLVENKITHEARFDIIAISGTNNSQKINHLERAFYPLIK